MCLLVAMGVVAAITACDGRGGHKVGLASSDQIAARARLGLAPFTELSFVPADAEAVVRVDLAALVNRDLAAAQALDPAQAPSAHPTQKMLDFLLQAQQPRLWKFLSDAGVRVGQELRVVYLVVGPRAAVEPAASMLIAGVGDIDVQRVRDALASAGGVAEAAPGKAWIIVWPHHQVALGVGSALPADLAEKKGRRPPDAEALLEESAVGVAAGLLLFGPPALVRRALAVRAGEGKDVRVGPLVDELAALDGKAAAWGVARQDAEGLVRDLAPGLRTGRFHLDLAGGGKGQLALRAEFGAPADAKAFASQLDTLIGAAALMTRKTPIGEQLSRLRATQPVRVDGVIVSIGTAL